MFEYLVERAWERTYESAPWDYLGHPPQLKHSFFGVPPTGRSSSHIISWVIYLLSGQWFFLPLKNTVKLLTEFPLAIIITFFSDLNLIRDSSNTSTLKKIFLFLLFPIDLSFRIIDGAVRCLLSPIITMGLGDPENIPAQFVALNVALLFIILPVLVALFYCFPLISLNILFDGCVTFFYIQFVAFNGRKACSEDIIEVESEEALERLRLTHRLITQNIERSLISESKEPVAEHFKDFDPNTTRCALTGKDLGIKEGQPEKLIVRAFSQNQYKYYLLEELQRISGSLPAKPTYDPIADRVPVHLQIKLDPENTTCPITLEDLNDPNETYYRSYYGHYYKIDINEEGEDKLIKSLRKNPSCPVTRQYLDEHGLKKVKMDILSFQSPALLSKNNPAFFKSSETGIDPFTQSATRLREMSL